MKVELTLDQITLVIEACRSHAEDLRSDNAVNGFVGEIIYAEELDKIINILSVAEPWSYNRASNR